MHTWTVLVLNLTFSHLIPVGLLVKRSTTCAPTYAPSVVAPSSSPTLSAAPTRGLKMQACTFENSTEGFKCAGFYACYDLSVDAIAKISCGSCNADGACREWHGEHHQVRTSNEFHTSSSHSVPYISLISSWRFCFRYSSWGIVPG